MSPQVFAVAELFTNEPPPLSDFGRRCWLAEGDSWFTIGSLNLLQNANVLTALQLTARTAIVSCAQPGDTLGHMADQLADPRFDGLLRRPNFSRWFEAILISGGGNDLIDAALHRAVHADGSAAALNERVLLTPAEAAVVNSGAAGPARYVSTAGWQTLAAYLVKSFAALVARRDDGPSVGRPMFAHTYHVPVVRCSGTVGSPKGWLFAAFSDYAIPRTEQQGLADLLFDQLRQLLLSLDSDSGHANALPQLHVFDSASLVPLIPASPSSTGASGDWINEIHPKRAGYAKVGAQMGPWIEALLLARYS